MTWENLLAIYLFLKLAAAGVAILFILLWLGLLLVVYLNDRYEKAQYEKRKKEQQERRKQFRKD